MKYSDFIKSKIRKIFPVLLAVVSLVIFYSIIGCPSKVFLGVTCPGCGMSRAAEALLKLDFQLAFQMHPLVFLLPIAVIVYLLRKKIPTKVLEGMAIAAVTVMIAVYLIRLFSGSEVVYVDFKKGLIYKLLQNLFGGG